MTSPTTPRDAIGLSERLREPVCLAYDAEQINAERRQAATQLDALSARVKELEAKSEKLNLHLQYFVERVQYHDSYGVPGSEFMACLCCRGGGAPGVTLIHEDHCPVGRSPDTYQDWCDEQREFERESRENAARATRAEQERDRVQSELDTANDNHRAMGAQLARIGQERDGAQRDAERYRFLRGRDLDTIHKGGVFAGMTPQNIILNEDDLDREVDAAIRSLASGPDKEKK